MGYDNIILDIEQGIATIDRMETLQEGELVRETLQEEGYEEVPQQSFWSRFVGVAQEAKEEEIRYVK